MTKGPAGSAGEGQAPGNDAKKGTLERKRWECSRPIRSCSWERKELFSSDKKFRFPKELTESGLWESLRKKAG